MNQLKKEALTYRNTPSFSGTALFVGVTVGHSKPPAPGPGSACKKAGSW